MTAQAKCINANGGLGPGSWPPGGGPGRARPARNLGQTGEEPSGPPGGRLGEGQQVRWEHVSRALSIASAPDRQRAGKRVERAHGGCGRASTQHPPGSEGGRSGEEAAHPGAWPAAAPRRLPTCRPLSLSGHRTGSLHASPTPRVPSPSPDTLSPRSPGRWWARARPAGLRVGRQTEGLGRKDRQNCGPWVSDKVTRGDGRWHTGKC